MSETQRPRVRIDASDLLLEIISIVVAILLALGVNNWQEGRKHHEQLVESLRDIRAELAGNLAQLQLAHPYHQRLSAGFVALLDRSAPSEQLAYRSISRTFQSSSTTGFHLMVPEDTAWTVAESSGAVQYMDHTARTQLTRTYGLQHLMDSTQHTFIDQLLTSRPAGNANFYYAMGGATQTLSDLVGIETGMLARYKGTLALVDRQLGSDGSR